MIVSPGRGYVFVHIPKTGGTAMALALEARAMKDDILIGDTPKAVARRRRLRGLGARGRLWKHSRLADLDGWLAPDAIRALRAVTLTRNPWDRMVSYYHWLGAQRFAHPAVSRARVLPFRDFIAHPGTRAEMRADGVADYLALADGTQPEAIAIRLERLDTDLAPFEDLLGFRLSLPHANRSSRPRDWAALYDCRTRDIVAGHYAEDIARFGYAFG
ncbi:Type II secretory pathway, pullulanase PulA [Palleronia sediminis]|uniref:Type II secretory pathway, pullulanase PulA n=1 Tax=Palleronia sediminis TaxID=2547833 RepID=A0A4R5ZTD9_9RHOB|nr:sulfotransferase family 2 domain-containing protein [Palleronia sediminis]TDL74220.1 Type II secretory pathway, pullulanase PulA [Palleronia sediminis]